MPIRKITIAGCGLIGGSLGSALRSAGFQGKITGCDQPEVLDKALRLGAIDEAEPTLQSAVGDADVVVLATPISAILALLPVVARSSPAHALITDTGSTKVGNRERRQKRCSEPPRHNDSCQDIPSPAKNAQASSRPTLICSAASNGCSRQLHYSRWIRARRPLTSWSG